MGVHCNIISPNNHATSNNTIIPQHHNTTMTACRPKHTARRPCIWHDSCRRKPQLQPNEAIIMPGVGITLALARTMPMVGIPSAISTYHATCFPIQKGGGGKYCGMKIAAWALSHSCAILNLFTYTVVYRGVPFGDNRLWTLL